MSAIVQHIQPKWQNSLLNLITEPEDLFDRLQLDTTYLPMAKKAVQLFPLRVTEHYLQQIEVGNLEDPLLKQILPLGAEFSQGQGFSQDPLDETQFNPVPGLLHKYQSRVLLTVTGACAIHCRYCFRRNFPYAKNNPGRKGWADIINYIKSKPRVNEVIYSGGDPLTATDAHLQALTKQLASLPQLTRLRVHTRLPLLIPERMTDELIHWLCGYENLQPIMVIHCNHPKELSHDAICALQKLKQAGVTLLNQSVLLKGVNDDGQTLIQLSEMLFTASVLPYYLHILDRVNGTAHFEVEVAYAKELMQQLQAQLPGFLVPKLTKEFPGAVAKTLLLD